MDIGVLLILNLATVPFIYEAEMLGRELHEFPNIGRILRLKNALKTRWVKMYGVYLFIFMLIAISPTRSGKSYSAGYELIAFIIFIQVILWMAVFYKIRNSKK